MVQQGCQNTAINLLCADATKTQSFSQGGPGETEGKTGTGIQHSRSGPVLPDPTPPVSEAVIDNIADRVLARIEERLALRLMPPKAQPPPPTAVLPNLASQAPLGPAVQNAVVSAPMTGQLPPATGPVPKVQTGTAPCMSLGRVPDQYHSPDKVTAQVLEAAAARLTGNHYVDTQSFFVSASTPTAAHIPIKVKEKIWANQFIEFHELLSPNPWVPSTAETEQHTSQELAADKAGRQQNTKREPLTLAQWLGTASLQS